MAGPATTSIQHGYVLKGTILSVNSRTYRAEVALDVANAALPDVAVAALYCHPFGGEGIYFLPEPDATCYVFFPSEPTGQPFIMGYVMPPTSDEGDAGGREPINPGDYILRGRDDNFIALRRGGVVEVGSTRLAQRLYIPVGNFIRDFFENYEAISLLGKMSWTHADPDLEQGKVTYAFECKEKVLDPAPRVTLEISTGELDLMPEHYTNTEKSAPEFSTLKQSLLRFKTSAPDFISREFTLQVGDGGDFFVGTKGYGLFAFDGPLRLETKKQLELIGPNSSDKTSVLGVRKVQLTSLEVEALGGIIQKATSVILDAWDVRLGGKLAFHPIGRGDVIEAWAAALVSILKKFGIPAPPLTGASSVRTRVP